MFMNKEDYDAWMEQQSREINNLRAMKYNERGRIITLIEKRIKACEENKVLFPCEEEKYQEIICRFEELITAINSQQARSKLPVRAGGNESD